MTWVFTNATFGDSFRRSFTCFSLDSSAEEEISKFISNVEKCAVFSFSEGLLGGEESSTDVSASLLSDNESLVPIATLLVALILDCENSSFLDVFTS